MKHKTGKIALWVALALALVIPLGTHAMVQSFFANKDEKSVSLSQEEYDQLQEYATLNLMVDIIDNFFYQVPDTEAMIDYATHATLYATDDPGTRYISEAESALLQQAGESPADIGVLLGWEKDSYLLRVRYVMPDSPAEQAGIQAGDYISGIGEEYYTGYEQDLAEAALRGEVDSEVEVTIFRNDMDLTYEEMIQELTLRRAVTEPAPSVLWEKLDDATGVIALLDIGENTSEDFARAMASLKEVGASRLILDLREAGGGTMAQLLPLAEQLLPAGEVAKLMEKEGETIYSVGGTGDPLPYAVLISPHTSDMAEVLAGAIQVLGAGELLGQQTLGSGTVQQFYPLGEEGAGVYITTGAYWTSAGLEIRDGGILPDEELEAQTHTWITSELGPADDAALQRALSHLDAKQEDTE